MKSETMAVLFIAQYQVLEKKTNTFVHDWMNGVTRLFSGKNREVFK